MPKYQLKLFMPMNGKLMIPTALLTLKPFDRCPSCEAERLDITRLSIKFACGMTQVLTDGQEFAVASGCPYSMSAIHEIRTRRIQRDDKPGMPPTLVTFAPEGFDVGDVVKWISTSGGRETVKKGVVVAIVPPEARPEDYIPDGMRRNSTNGYGRARPHTTYLIKVRGKGSRVYWPRVHYLEKQEQKKPEQRKLVR